MRAVCTNFSADELLAFCKDSKYHFAFASSRVDQYSYSAVTLSHGIWSYCLINALKGEVKDALEKGRLVTGNSLQTYLADEVPRLLRKTIAGAVSQTPCAFGNFTNEFVVADVGPILEAKAAKASTIGALLKDSFLRGEESGQIRSLSGFKKGIHKVPDYHSSRTEAFVSQAGSDEVTSQAKTIYDAVRGTFGYKFKDIDFSNSGGAATIKTPDFDVNVWIQQDKDDVSAYLLTTDVGSIRRPSVLEEEAFNDVFSEYCDTVVIELSKSIDVSEKIGQIEDIKEFKDHLGFTAEGDKLTLDMPAEGVCLHATENQLTLTSLNRGDLKTLLSNAQKSLIKLGSSGITLLLPETTSP
jgi:hypothetical protein